jgi:hypothetical protein
LIGISLKLEWMFIWLWKNCKYIKCLNEIEGRRWCFVSDSRFRWIPRWIRSTLAQSCLIHHLSVFCLPSLFNNFDPYFHFHGIWAILGV